MSSLLQNELRSLDDHMCEALLARHNTGRFVYTEPVWPAVVPMNYRFHDGKIVMRACEGSMARNAPMSAGAFEIDGFDHYGTWGWSVVGRGYVSDITEATDRTSLTLRELPIWPMSPGEYCHWLSISVRQLTGRFFGEPPEFAQI